jgi:hypothetical protein
MAVPRYDGGPTIRWRSHDTMAVTRLTRYDGGPTIRWRSHDTMEVPRYDGGPTIRWRSHDTMEVTRYDGGPMIRWRSHDTMEVPRYDGGYAPHAIRWRSRASHDTMAVPRSHHRGSGGIFLAGTLPTRSCLLSIVHMSIMKHACIRAVSRIGPVLVPAKKISPLSVAVIPGEVVLVEPPATETLHDDWCPQIPTLLRPFVR